MGKIDKIVFGDNQFFGINHRSEQKAEELAKKFSDLNNIINVYDNAISCGINAIMLNSNQRAQEITDYFRAHQDKYSNIAWYPSIPYPHKYANAVSEKGIMEAVTDMLFSNNTVMGGIGRMFKGGTAVLNKDMLKLMEMLIDMEVSIFKGLDVRVIFLQNVITDLILGYDIKDVFMHYCDYIRKKYNVIPGFITLNMPYLRSKLVEWGIKDVVICSTINKIGSNMHPSKDEYERVIKENDPKKYQLMAMSTMASGAIPVKEAYEYINGLNLQSVTFGASSLKNISETTKLINLK